jgi:hypothetical protein
MTECAIQQDLCPIFRGDSVPFNFTFTQPDGTALDITDMTLTFTMKEYSDDPEAVLQKSVVFPDSQESRDGIGSMKILPSETADLEPGIKYYYDFQLETVDGDIFTLGTGRIMVNQDITV